MSRRGGIVRTLALMLVVPPLILLLWAHLLRSLAQGSEYFALTAAGLAGLAGVATAPWSTKTRAMLAAAYVLLAGIALPFIGLFAVCSTGDCL